MQSFRRVWLQRFLSTNAEGILHREHLMARGYLDDLFVRSSSLHLAHLHWMQQKDALKQDILLVGPSSPIKRRLALAFGELIRRPVQVVTVTSDLTESDLKQRRELKNRQSNNNPPVLDLIYENASPVDAAIHGDILILDGIERASRNVLPTLNNLLEHRSMNLEDGRLLVPHHHYQVFSNKESSSSLIPVHPNFRVIATAVPPGLPGGRALDPPLRSRFQIRRIQQDLDDIVNHIIGSNNYEDDEMSVVKFIMALEMAALKKNPDTEAHVGQPHHPWPVHQLASTVELMRQFPAQDPKVFLQRFYPLAVTRDNRGGNRDDSSFFERLYKDTVTRRRKHSTTNLSPYKVGPIAKDPENPYQSQVIFVASELSHFHSHSVTLSVPCGQLEDSNKMTWKGRPYCLTQGLQSVLTSMLQAHGAGHDILLISPPGEGKSVAVSYFCALLHYKMRLVHIYPEMTLTDLFLRRNTTTRGETSWEPSTMLQAIQDGDVCVLDHVHKMRPDVLAGLQSLCLERDFFLPDGRRVTRWNSDEPGSDPRVVRVHPSFRLIALGSKLDGTWLTQDAQGMFSTIVLPPPTSDCYRAIIAQSGDCPSDLIDKLLHFHATLTDSVAADCGVMPLSTRNMIRVVKQLLPSSTVSDLYQALWQVFVADLLPPLQKSTLESILQQVGILSRRKHDTKKGKETAIHVAGDMCTIGDFSMQRRQVQRPEKVPSPKFFDIPSHVDILKDLLWNWNRGERSFLLLGSQGVGKNVLVDRLCQIANFEREYIQLHRDSTIGQLTLLPTLENGRIVWNDSPLVRAVTQGLLLVVDEADKAPTEVLAVLKGLVEDGDLLLGDGRRISVHESGPGIIEMHPDFTLFVLANKPGFPFLGNAFFKQIGDCFAARVVANPDLESEIRLLQSYGPSLKPTTVKSIAASFAELRALSENGDISYPYSTREAVAVVKHLADFPEDGVVSALHNVIDFDSFDDVLYGTLGLVFQRNGIPVETYASWQEAIRRQGIKLMRDNWGERTFNHGASPASTPPDASTPKLGKWDEQNLPHFGGNQWAGGSGGSDTAGLGGRGGPFRLDRGHEVKQVSDEAKRQVTNEAAKAARAMAREALEDRLKEIDMSDMEWNMYHRFVGAIEKDIKSLKAILSQADIKQTERSWITRQSHGELDEMRLVDGVTGSRNIYKRRSINSDDTGPPLEPKRLHFVVDVSGSMYRFNGFDGRLNRCLEATSLVMESLDGFERLFEYSIVGHSGDSSGIRFVHAGKIPANEKQRLRILQMMIAHSQYCQAGDNTLEALSEAIHEASERNESRQSDSIVIAISDANLERYGIHPRALGRVIESGNDASVTAHCIFIASFGDEAEEILRELPSGRGHICFQTSDLPRIVKNIIAAQF